jgi:hypothetical protein
MRFPRTKDEREIEKWRQGVYWFLKDSNITLSDLSELLFLMLTDHGYELADRLEAIHKLAVLSDRTENDVNKVRELEIRIALLEGQHGGEIADIQQRLTSLERRTQLEGGI